MIKHDMATSNLYVTRGPVSRKISINPDFNDDPFYRYKVNQLIIEITKGKTFLTNIDEVAQQLKIDSIYIVRYFGSILGTQVKYDKKVTNTKRAYISGIFSVDKLSELLLQFIEKVILCKECGLPELDYFVDDNKVSLVCRSCGSNHTIHDSLQKYINSRP